MPITADIQTLEPGAWVELFELDATTLGAELYRFHGYPQQSSIYWQGVEYSPWPIKAEGFEMTGQGAQPMPTLSVGNVGGFITALVLYFEDLVGAKLIRHRTLGKYLDGQPEADPDEELPPDIWYVERKTAENNETVQFELASALDFAGVQLPRRQIVANVCWWLSCGGYRGPYCGYNGGPVADENDIIVTDASKDKCGGRLSSCKLRFGENNPLPYGSFPAAGLLRS
ncbi:phage minor tail protein L [Pseudomonas protegens Cab57]|uniref:Phage minor tail protein L n=1 Tax=Pseudomonas sp. W17 TaxID=3144407 RepID=A0AAU7WML3_9PSED|nr:phage minor tail protein L [Pseudomonas protegens]BAO62811.1 phage minor tail protein L [Pseudomonas protegens Cab57]